MYLSDRDIADRLDDGSLAIDPLTDFEQQIQPASVDLRLDENFLTFNDSNGTYIDPTDPRTLEELTTEHHVPNDEAFGIEPGEFVLGSTAEHVEIPHDLLGIVGGRSTFGRLGIIIHATAGIIDTRYRGQITLEIKNLGPNPVSLYPGSRIAQLMLVRLTSPSERPYGAERNSKYQDQSGPVASKITDDPEYE